MLRIGQVVVVVVVIVATRRLVVIGGGKGDGVSRRVSCEGGFE